jgi:hypothetical protein
MMMIWRSGDDFSLSKKKKKHPPAGKKGCRRKATEAGLGFGIWPVGQRLGRANLKKSMWELGRPASSSHSHRHIQDKTTTEFSYDEGDIWMNTFVVRKGCIMRD